MLKKSLNALLIFGFFVLLTLPTIAKIAIRENREGLSENRTLAPFPVYEGDEKAFLAGLDAYLTDHFGFRRRLIAAHNAIQLRFLNRSPVPEVVLGSDGWLFLGAYRVMEYTRRVPSFSEQDKLTWRDALRRRQDYARSRGAEYLFVVMPNKEEMYGEHLPFWMKGPSGRESEVSEIVRTSAADGIRAVYLLDALKTRRIGSELAYYRTDTHWNAVGGMIGAYEVIRTLGRPTDPVRRERFSRAVPSEIRGDLMRMMGVEFAPVPEPTMRYEPPEGWAWRSADNIYFHSVDGWTRLEFNNPKGAGTALIFGDSFLGAISPYLAESFLRLVIYRTHEGIAEKMTIERPTVVIDAFVERNVPMTQPATLLDFQSPS